jgi:hypothetical protein
MKKTTRFFATMALACACLAANATDIGLTVGRNSNGQEVTQVSGTQAVKGYDVQLSVAAVNGDLSKLTTEATVGKQLLKVGPVGVGVFAGVGYTRTNDVNGFGAVGGVQATVQVAQNVDLVFDARRFQGGDKVADLNTNTVSVGVNVKF